MCASSSVLRAPESLGNISRHNFLVKFFSLLSANKLRANKMNFLKTACDRLLSAIMEATTYSWSPIQKPNIVPFCILFVTVSVIDLPSVFAAILVEAGIRLSLRISDANTGITTLAGKTFPFLRVTALLGRICPGSLGRLPSTLSWHKRAGSLAKTARCGKVTRFWMLYEVASGR